jgi:hypothetical protein
MTVSALIMLVATCLSADALAQAAPPKVGTKPLVQVKPKVPMGCKFVGTVKGTKLWAGDCAATPELRGTTLTDEPATPAPAPDAKQ